MGKCVDYLDRTFYPNHPAGWDDIEFRKAVLKHLKPDHLLLDFGAGRGANPRLSFRDSAAQVYGTDVDEAVLSNSSIHHGKLMEGARIPFDDQQFDCVVSSYVLEHLSDPLESFKEIFRVLKPGGIFVARTPNRFHYLPLIAQCTPHQFHQFVNARRGRLAHDTFPTYYRANSVRRITSLALASNFVLEKASLIDGRPEYMRFNALTYSIGLIYQRAVTRISALAWLRPLIILELRKPLFFSSSEEGRSTREKWGCSQLSGD